jgi:glycosyltransferase involved in cell wall biosynthesis
MSRVPITVCIIAKDEERYIEGCLKRLMPYGFEIIVTDTGSSDRTKEIASKYADKVLDFKWIDDFSAARNFCAEHASNNWILSIDCDEYVEKVDLRVVRMYMQKLPKGRGLIKLTDITINKDGNKRYSSDDVVRFYNKNFYHYEKPIHEQIEGMREGLDNRVFIMPMEVIHHGYEISKEEMLVKQQRNLDMLYKLLDKGVEEDGGAYIHFQIGQSEYLIDHFDKSVEHLEKALSLVPPDTDLLYVETLIYVLNMAYRAIGRPDLALELMNKYEGKYNTANFVFMQASTYLINNNILKALVYYLKAVAMPDVDTLGDSLLECYENIVRIYTDMGETDMANMFVEKRDALRAEKERVLNA